ncbi:MAG: hypothetical protein QNK30_10975 [Bacteroidales bacterium]|nr:hypothetical protein [Bacteroidales bacterium]
MKLIYWLFVAIFALSLSGCNLSNSDKQSGIDDSKMATNDAYASRKTKSKIDSLTKVGFEIIDLHAHLKGGLTVEQLLKHSKKTGIKYGIAANCGVGFPIQNDSALSAYYYSLKMYPVYIAMQAEGREWVNLFSPDSIAMFDYVFTDAMTFTDPNGKRTRLWMNDEVNIIDPEVFMEFYVLQIVKIMSNEKVNIYVNPTFLPEVIRDQYDALWTDNRINAVAKALKENNIACEINARYMIPSAYFIKMAKKAGVKFTMGTNNGGADLGYLEYSLAMIDKCDLTPDDFWKPEKK